MTTRVGTARFDIRIPLPGTQAERDEERRRTARLFGWDASTVQLILGVRDEYMQAARRGKFGPGPILGNYGWYASRARILNHEALRVRRAIAD